MTGSSQSDRERFPELFNEEPSADRRKCKPVVPMKVLVLGLMRTGTATMIVSTSLILLGLLTQFNILIVQEHRLHLSYLDLE